MNIDGFWVVNYENIFTIDSNRMISMIKVRLIQAMIQIQRPTGWGIEKIRQLALELKCIEKYNPAAKQKFFQAAAGICVMTTKWCSHPTTGSSFY